MLRLCIDLFMFYLFFIGIFFLPLIALTLRILVHFCQPQPFFLLRFSPLFHHLLLSLSLFICFLSLSLFFLLPLPQPLLLNLCFQSGVEASFLGPLKDEVFLEQFLDLFRLILQCENDLDAEFTLAFLICGNIKCRFFKSYFLHEQILDFGAFSRDENSKLRQLSLR